MSYISTRPLVRIARPVPVSGLWDDVVDFFNPAGNRFGDAGIDPDCQAAADAKTASLDQETGDLAKNWAATNSLYRPGDMAKLRDQVMNLLAAASNALDTAGNTTGDIETILTDRRNQLQQKMSDSLAFTNAINDATAKGLDAIESTGFKDWVINSMTKASIAIRDVNYLKCVKPTLIAIIDAAVGAAQVAWDALVAAVRALTKFAADVGKLVLKVPNTVSDIMDYLKYGALIVGGYYTYKLITKMK